ncbi:tol-pal system protein YbgF [Epibacterium sp. SM1969]|uniref:Cell division coordinator CpoB n=1 Tax=Tritonibacter aquimaris TaxID=2663379 RepID=A0A844AYR0_9RHOB|nr:tol-pal system protein YbgF [Tritonibacter aquimaris]MQY43081.1 tol-pal system protein YbgF [Tritonibacter aquimaris]
MRLLKPLILSVLVFSVKPAFSQDAETLADIRQELSVLNVEILKLKRELSTTGAPSTNLVGDTVLDRVTAIESELQRLTARTEQMDFRINSIVRDGTNRIGDLEFRLVELEGGDVSQLGETSTLGGVAPEVKTESPVASNNQIPDLGELAVAERADFEAAQAALGDENFSVAAEKFALFSQTYPASPLAVQASLMRGKAHDGLGDSREAARAYLAAFSGDTSGPKAPEALFELGAALGRLGQSDQACITLAEVAQRFPASPMVASAESERSKLACQ